MGIVAADPSQVPIVVGLKLLSSILLLIMVIMLLLRRNLQPIKFRGPMLLVLVGSSLSLRQFIVVLFSLFPEEMPCGTFVIFSVTFYSALAISCWRLFVLLFSYKLQEERLQVQSREDRIVTEKEWWMKHIYLARGSNMWPVVFLAIVIPTILETANLKELSIEEALELKMNVSSEGLLGNTDEAFGYVSFRDRCRDGFVFGSFYEVVMAVYLIFVLIMAVKLRTFDKDRFFINLEFRLTALWMLLFIATDFTLLIGIYSESDDYWNAYGARNEAVWLLPLGLIMFYFPVYKSYKVNRTKMTDTNSDFETYEGRQESLIGSSQKAQPSQSPYADPMKFAKGSKPERLVTFLQDKKFAKAFETHARLEFSIENVLFYFDAKDLLERLRLHIQKLDSMDTFDTMIDQSIAKFKKLLIQIRRLLDTYIKQDANLQVNVSHVTRQAMESSLKVLEDADAEQAMVSIDDLRELEYSLSKCLSEICVLMANDTFVRFKNSPDGAAFLATHKQNTTGRHQKKTKSRIDKSGKSGFTRTSDLDSSIPGEQSTIQSKNNNVIVPISNSSTALTETNVEILNPKDENEEISKIA